MISRCWFTLLTGSLFAIVSVGEYQSEERWKKFVPPKEQQQIELEASNYFSNGKSSVHSLSDKDLNLCDDSDPNTCARLAPKQKLWKTRNFSFNVVIPYHIADEFDENFAQVIRDQLQVIQNQTCLEFEASGDFEPGAAHILFLATTDSSCYVSPQERADGSIIVTINTNNNCGIMDHNGIILHLVMHALGFPHEHLRNDRDQYIEINLTNVLPDRHKDFEKDPADVKYDTKYDYDSIMHPYYTYLAIDLHIPTLFGRQGPARSLGQREYLSVDDVKKIKKAFCQQTPEEVSDEPTVSQVRTRNQPDIEIDLVLPSKSSAYLSTFIESVTRTSTIFSTVTQTVTAEAVTREQWSTVIESVTNTKVIYATVTDTITLPHKECFRIKTIEPVYGEAENQQPPIITPSRTRKCPIDKVTIFNIQTLSQTTMWEDLKTRWNQVTKKSTRSMQAINYGDLLAPIPALFEGRLIQVKTTIVDLQTMIFHTLYEDDTLNDGSNRHQESFETRYWNC